MIGVNSIQTAIKFNSGRAASGFFYWLVSFTYEPMIEQSAGLFMILFFDRVLSIGNPISIQCVAENELLILARLV